MVSLEWLDNQVIALAGSLLLGLVATVLLVEIARRARHPAESAAEGGLRPWSNPSVGDESGWRVEQASLVLTALLGPDYPVSVDQFRERLVTSGQVPVQCGYLQAPGEIADGLLMIARVVPQVALHDSNVELLRKLRSLVGSKDFLFVCGQVAVALRDDRQHNLAQGLANGDLTWIEFLCLLRGLLPAEALCSDYRVLTPKDMTEHSHPGVGLVFPLRML